MFNILIGILLIVGGLTGKMALIFTDSSKALVVLGVGLVAWGIAQVVQRRKKVA